MTMREFFTSLVIDNYQNLGYKGIVKYSETSIIEPLCLESFNKLNHNHDILHIYISDREDYSEYNYGSIQMHLYNYQLDTYTTDDNDWESEQKICIDQFIRYNKINQFLS